MTHAHDSEEVRKTHREDVRLVNAFSAFTQRFSMLAGPLLGPSLMRSALRKSRAEHPILQGCEVAGGQVNIDAMCERLAESGDVENVANLRSAFTMFTATLGELMSEILSPTLAGTIIAAAVEASNGEYSGILADTGMFTDEYKNLAYKHGLLSGLPDGVAEHGKAKTIAYALFKEVLEPLLRACQPKTIAKVAEALASSQHSLAKKVRLTDSGTFTLSSLYRELPNLSPERAANDVAQFLSETIARVYPHICREMGAKRAELLITSHFRAMPDSTSLALYKHGIIRELPNGILDEEKLSLLSRAELEQRVKLRTTELEHAYGALEKLAELRAELIDILSHDLRSPLAPVKGYIELFKSGELGKVTKTQKDALSTMASSLDKVETLVKDLLESSRVEAKGLELILTPTNMNVLVNAIVTETRFNLEQKNHKLAVELPDKGPIIACDKPMLDTVLRNLLTNAIKYTPHGGRISVRLTEDAANVHLEVTDTGPGIPKKVQARIFDRFYRVEARASGRSKGLGLGLYITRRIVERHRGEIRVESELGKGSTLHVVLPKRLNKPG